MFDFGGNAPLQITTYNAAGVAQNATSVTLAVTLPDGTTQAPTVTVVGSGVYTATGPTTQAGRYTIVWTATGTNADQITDQYDVRPAASYSILSMSDARKCVNFTKTLNDSELRDYMDAVTALIERRIGPVIPRTFTEILSGFESLQLTYSPVVSLTSITSKGLAGQLTIDVTDLVFDPLTGAVCRKTRLPFYGDPYTVVYVAGRGVDQDVMQAARVTLQHIWNNQRPNAPTRDGDTYRAPFTLPPEAESILGPLESPPVG